MAAQMRSGYAIVIASAAAGALLKEIKSSREAQPVAASASSAPPFEAVSGGIRAPFRADIQGLRAVAVLLVVIYHTGAVGLAGGCVGVDVIFVICGFLIMRITLTTTIVEKLAPVLWTGLRQLLLEGGRNDN